MIEKKGLLHTTLKKLEKSGKIVFCEKEIKGAKEQGVNVKESCDHCTSVLGIATGRIGVINGCTTYNERTRGQQINNFENQK